MALFLIITVTAAGILILIRILIALRRDSKRRNTVDVVEIDSKSVEIKDREDHPSGVSLQACAVTIRCNPRSSKFTEDELDRITAMMPD
jgi:hypothetical protein